MDAQGLVEPGQPLGALCAEEAHDPAAMGQHRRQNPNLLICSLQFCNCSHLAMMCAACWASKTSRLHSSLKLKSKNPITTQPQRPTGNFSTQHLSITSEVVSATQAVPDAQVPEW